MVLAGSPFRIPPVRRSGLVAGTRRAVGLASGLEVAGAVSALLAMNPSDGGAGPLPGLPLNRIARLQAERLQDITRPVGFDRQPGGAPLPGQDPHDWR